MHLCLTNSLKGMDWRWEAKDSRRGDAMRDAITTVQSITSVL